MIRGFPLDLHRDAVLVNGRPDVECGEHRGAEDEQRRLGEMPADTNPERRDKAKESGQGPSVYARTHLSTYRRPNPNVTSAGSRPWTSKYPASSRKRSGLKSSGCGYTSGSRKSALRNSYRSDITSITRQIRQNCEQVRTTCSPKRWRPQG